MLSSFDDIFLYSIRSANKSQAATILRLTNLINAGLAIFAGIWTLLALDDILTLNVPSLALSLYLTLFGCLLCCFEFRIGFIERNVRDYFGFMFTYCGRSVFLLFLGTFCIGLKADQSVGIIIGVLTYVNALLNCFVMYRHGEYFDDPTKKYQTAENVTQEYVQNNPELVQQAVGAGVSFAANNPQVAQQGAQAFQQYARENPTQAAQAMNSVTRS